MEYEYFGGTTETPQNLKRYVSLSEHPLCDDDMKYAEIVYVYNGTVVAKLYDIYKYRSLKSRNIAAIKAKIMISLDYKTGKDHGPICDSNINIEAHNIWKIVNIMGQDALCSCGIINYSTLMDLPYEDQFSVLRVNAIEILKELSLLMFSKKLNNLEEYKYCTDYFYYFGTDTLPKYIYFLNKFRQISHELLVDSTRQKMAFVYKLSCCVMDNFIDNFPDDKHIFENIKKHLVCKKLVT